MPGRIKADQNRHEQPVDQHQHAGLIRAARIDGNGLEDDQGLDVVLVRQLYPPWTLLSHGTAGGYSNARS